MDRKSDETEWRARWVGKRGQLGQRQRVAGQFLIDER